MASSSAPRRGRASVAFGSEAEVLPAGSATVHTTPFPTDSQHAPASFFPPASTTARPPKDQTVSVALSSLKPRGSSPNPNPPAPQSRRAVETAWFLHSRRGKRYVGSAQSADWHARFRFARTAAAALVLQRSCLCLDTAVRWASSAQCIGPTGRPVACEESRNPAGGGIRRWHGACCRMQRNGCLGVRYYAG